MNPMTGLTTDCSKIQTALISTQTNIMEAEITTGLANAMGTTPTVGKIVTIWGLLQAWEDSAYQIPTRCAFQAG